jgi:hypothetical protein
MGLDAAGVDVAAMKNRQRRQRRRDLLGLPCLSGEQTLLQRVHFLFQSGRQVLAEFGEVLADSRNLRQPSGDVDAK